MRKKLFKWPVLLMSFVSLTLCSCSTARTSGYIHEADYSGTIKVACVGDSITFGAGIRNRNRDSYPAQLGVLLGQKWEVRNFGVSGATLLKKGDRPYWDQKAYKESLAFKPDVVVIMLGTNDSKPVNWRYKDQFADDYVALVQSFQALASKPKIWICRPVPAFPGRWGIREQIIKDEIIPMVDEVARRTGVSVLDLHQALSGHGNLFPDTVHPNPQGAGLMAQAICQTLTGRQVNQP